MRKRRTKTNSTRSESDFSKSASGIRSSGTFIQLQMSDTGLSIPQSREIDQSGRDLHLSNPSFPFGRAILCLAFLLVPLVLLNPHSTKARAGFSDDQKDAELRTIHGIVIDKNENGVPSSIVYLENMKTQSVRTYIVDDSGNYRFSGLDPNEDYEIHAEKGGLISSTRTISSFDSRRDIEVVLKLIHKKK